MLYLGDRTAVEQLVARSGAELVPSANPYWDWVGVTINDPDGFRIVPVADTWTGRRTAHRRHELPGRCGGEMAPKAG